MTNKLEMLVIDMFDYVKSLPRYCTGLLTGKVKNRATANESVGKDRS